LRRFLNFGARFVFIISLAASFLIHLHSPRPAMPPRPSSAVVGEPVSRALRSMYTVLGMPSRSQRQPADIEAEIKRLAERRRRKQLQAAFVALRIYCARKRRIQAQLALLLKRQWPTWRPQPVMAPATAAHAAADDGGRRPDTFGHAVDAYDARLLEADVEALRHDVAHDAQRQSLAAVVSPAAWLDAESDEDDALDDDAWLEAASHDGLPAFCRRVFAHGVPTR